MKRCQNLQNLSLTDVIFESEFIVREIYQDNVTSMKSQIEDGGDLPPILVVKRGEKYLCLDGRHRHQAYIELKRESIPAYIEPDGEPHHLLELSITSNLYGRNLTSTEKIAALKRYLLVAPNTESARAIALKFRVSHTTVQKYLFSGQNGQTQESCHQTSANLSQLDNGSETPDTYTQIASEGYNNVDDCSKEINTENEYKVDAIPQHIESPCRPDLATNEKKRITPFRLALLSKAHVLFDSMEKPIEVEDDWCCISFKVPKNFWETHKGDLTKMIYKAIVNLNNL